MTIALVLALQAAATVATPADRQVPDVVVTPRPIATLRRDLENCLARRCPPKEDIAASLAYAEGQFVAGDHAGSRTTLLAAVATRVMRTSCRSRFPTCTGPMRGLPA